MKIGWGHMGWGYGNYDPASNPTVKRLAEKISIAAIHVAPHRMTNGGFQP
jgi:hypothetical protein